MIERDEPREYREFEGSPGVAPAQSHDLGFSTPATGRGWFWGLMFLGSPTMFLVMLTARYALRDPACGHSGARIALDVCALLSLGVSSLIAITAWRHWKAEQYEWSNDAPDPVSRERFLAIVCFTIALFGIACALALWAPTFFIAVCDTQ